jgi:hypothetical protein
MHIGLVDHVEPPRPERDHKLVSDRPAIGIPETLRSFNTIEPPRTCAHDFSASSFSFAAGTRSMDSPHPHAPFWFGLLNTKREERRSTL